MTTNSLFPTYNRADIAFEKGEGVWLVGTDGRRYLDMGSGIAVTSVGHAHPHLVAVLQEAATKVWHTSNLYRIPEQERLADRLTAATFAERVFFCNSGAEANEAAIKTARRYQYVSGHPERVRIVTFQGAFHGRTLGALAATGVAKYMEGFGEPAPGFDKVPLGDLDAVKAVIGPETAAIMVEPVQGEGGVQLVDREFLRALRKLCDDHGLVLIFDEIQTGVGRFGTLFAYEALGVTPDILSAAKGLGGGFPIGACLATAAVGDAMTPGTHGTTFGGTPLACAVSNAVLDVVLADGFLDEVKRKGAFLMQSLAGVVDSHPSVFETVRGEGLMVGVKCRAPAGDVALAARDAGLLVVPAGDNVVRFLPGLVATEEDLREAARRLDAAGEAVEKAKKDTAVV
ncbi:aspartate aminotransferase family protein [Acuticoccus sp. I52.16.1]|uniref:aspartate aminotransferase family protein n=1 Tax=Acuticoccus sp. I52.16.1 TaxID=2928472 RepID=UPI001FD1A6CC|nr:aspartate aminotransferase family protein [Acuticoccus sp. I52.16.1]UOM32762.1 aspartate aminotransferase family protein [Acuticoccus sp. I52.16.1]